MIMIFSENRTNKQVPAQPRVQNISNSTYIPPTPYKTNLKSNIFQRLQNVTKCKSCGK